MTKNVPTPFANGMTRIAVTPQSSVGMDGAFGGLLSNAQSLLPMIALTITAWMDPCSPDVANLQAARMLCVPNQDSSIAAARHLILFALTRP